MYEKYAETGRLVREFNSSIFKSVRKPQNEKSPNRDLWDLLQAKNRQGPFRKMEWEVFPEPEDKESTLHVVWEMLRPNPEERLSSDAALQKYTAAILKEDPEFFSRFDPAKDNEIIQDLKCLFDPPPESKVLSDDFVLVGPDSYRGLSTS